MAKFKQGNKKRFNEVARSQQSGAALGPNRFQAKQPKFDANGKIKKKNRRGGGSGKGSFKLVFDRDKRIEFVTGFKKRKDERRAKAKELALEEKKDERKELKDHKRKER